LSPHQSLFVISSSTGTTSVIQTPQTYSCEQMETNLYRPSAALRKLRKSRCCAFLFSPLVHHTAFPLPSTARYCSARIISAAAAAPDSHWWSALMEFDHFQARHELNDALIKVPRSLPPKQWDSHSFILTIVSSSRLIFPPILVLIRSRPAWLRFCALEP
jgi:hypothetical protein